MDHLNFWKRNVDLQTSIGVDTNNEKDYESQVTGNFNPISLQATDVSKSVKADDAEVPLGLWNDEIFKGSISGVAFASGVHDSLLEALRNSLGIRWFRKRLFSSYTAYMRKVYGHSWPEKLCNARKYKSAVHGEIVKDGNRGANAIRRGVNSSWWTWDAGSSLFFWRWTDEVKLDARDGSSFPWKFYPLPSYKIPQKYPKNPLERELVAEKVKVPIKRGYIETGLVKSLSASSIFRKAKLQLKANFKLHVLHVAGTRMIEQGTDGL